MTPERGARSPEMALSLGILLLAMLLLTGCSEPPAVSAAVLPDADTPSGRLVREKCGSCHAAPHPRLHPAALWPSVVQRMQLRMQTKAGVTMTAEEMALITGYLQQHATGAPAQTGGIDHVAD